jgi:lipopolysaccharide transport system permease protein
MKSANVTWDKIIDSQYSVFKLDFKDLWFYRDLLFLLVKRDFVSFYKQTILGPIWFFVQPIFTTLVYTFVFGGLANLGTDGIPQPLFYLAGITMWNYFSDCVTKTSTVFKDNANIFGKVYFPRLIMPLSIIVSNLVRFLVQFLLLLLVLVYYIFSGIKFDISWYIILTPLLVFLMALLGLGLGLIIAALTTKYRDLAFLVTFGIQLVMYTTTVIYPLSNAPSNYKSIIILNPMTGIIEAFRFLFLGHGQLNLGILGYSVLFTFVVLISGILIFNKTEKSFVDTV